jgi:hypothetical protein
MQTKISYRWVLGGIYYYALFQLIYLARFGSLNTTVSSLDAWLIIVGMCSVAVLLYYANKGALFWKLLIAFLIAIPLSLVLALIGGLFGAVGVFAAGLLPFVILLSVGYWLAKPRSEPA